MKAVDLPLALHERRRFGTYGGMYGRSVSRGLSRNSAVSNRIPVRYLWFAQSEWWHLSMIATKATPSPMY